MNIISKYLMIIASSLALVNCYAAIQTIKIPYGKEMVNIVYDSDYTSNVQCTISSDILTCQLIGQRFIIYSDFKNFQSSPPSMKPGTIQIGSNRTFYVRAGNILKDYSQVQIYTTPTDGSLHNFPSTITTFAPEPE